MEMMDFLVLDARLLFEALALRFQALPDEHLRGHNAHQFTVGLRVLNRVYGSAHRVGSNLEFDTARSENLNRSTSSNVYAYNCQRLDRASCGRSNTASCPPQAVPALG